MVNPAEQSPAEEGAAAVKIRNEHVQLSASRSLCNPTCHDSVGFKCWQGVCDVLLFEHLWGRHTKINRRSHYCNWKSNRREAAMPKKTVLLKIPGRVCCMTANKHLPL